MIDVTLTAEMMGNQIYCGMSPYAKNLYILLLSMRETEESDHVVCSYKQIRELLCVCNVTARNAIKELEFRGFIRLSKECGLTNIFYFIDDWRNYGNKQQTKGCKI